VKWVWVWVDWGGFGWFLGWLGEECACGRVMKWNRHETNVTNVINYRRQRRALLITTWPARWIPASFLIPHSSSGSELRSPVIRERGTIQNCWQHDGAHFAFWPRIKSVCGLPQIYMMVKLCYPCWFEKLWTLTIGQFCAKSISLLVVIKNVLVNCKFSKEWYSNVNRFFLGFFKNYKSLRFSIVIAHFLW